MRGAGAAPLCTERHRTESNAITRYSERSRGSREPRLPLPSCLFEIAGTLSLKLAQGLTRPLPSLGLCVCMGLSLYLLSTAVQAAIPIGTAYAIWTG